MGFQLDGRAIVVTGGGNGIGAALCTQAVARGASAVAVVDIDEQAGQQVADRINTLGVTATAYQCDVSDAEAVEATTERIVATHGSPGLVVANAGVMAPTAPLLDMNPVDIEWLMGVNLRGVIHTIQSFGRRLVAHDADGWLLATGSEHSLGVPHLFGAPYTASKHAILGVCDVLRGELPDHVGVSVVCPGLTVSELWNSTTTRPDRYGGAQDGDQRSGAFMQAAGMSADTVAIRALDGVARGDFVIPTHYNARLYAERRTDEVTAAFEHLAEVDTTDYDIGNLLTGLLSPPADESAPTTP